MEYIIGFVILSLIVYAISVKMFPHEITGKEVIIGLILQIAISTGFYYMVQYSTGIDRQILNGQVTAKSKVRVSCEHSYSCNCTNICSGSGKDRSCSKVCQTCYEHAFDYNWRVESTVGSLNINRIDRQGAKEPPRWHEVEIGEFFATEGSYFNYIKASPLTIFEKADLESKIEIPPYISVYDYYRIKRVQDFQSLYKGDFSRLNDLLNDHLKYLGPEKKVNVVVLFHSFGDDFVNVVKAKNYGGKINDVYVMINADVDGNIKKVDVFSWSKDDMVNVAIRDGILDMKTINMDGISNVIISNIEKYFVKRSIKEFEYLDANIEIPNWALYLFCFFGILFPAGWSFAAKKYNIC